MTPKEKAEELLLRYLKVKTHKMFNGWWHKITAKQCALIAVDEVISADWYIPTAEDYKKWTSYWKEVKYEIEKL
jgi:uncharacterized membrane protein